MHWEDTIGGLRNICFVKGDGLGGLFKLAPGTSSLTVETISLICFKIHFHVMYPDFAVFSPQELE